MPASFYISFVFTCTANAAILLVLAAMASLSSGSCIAAGIWSHVNRQSGAREYARSIVATVLAYLVGVMLGSLGLRQCFSSAQAESIAALWWIAVLASSILAAVCPACASILAASLAALGAKPGQFILAGRAICSVITLWYPDSPRGALGTSSIEAEHDFEITMASGEELEAEEREYIENILELGDTTASEVLTPRTDVAALDIAWAPERILSFVAESRFSRFPVFEGSIDNVVGILHLRDLLEYVAQHESVDGMDLRELIMEPNFVPASRKVDDVLRDLQRRKGHMAIVLDEYGGTSGILTIEDLLEEIVGEIQDEYDEESKEFHLREDGKSWVVSAQVMLEDFNEELQAQLGAEDVDTLGGYITSLLGRIPKARESVEGAGWRFTVLSVARNRIGRVLAERLAVAELPPK